MASAAPLSLGGGKSGSYAFVVNGCLPNWHLWVADKEARGPADIWGNGPLAASSPDPLVAVTPMCGLLCMCTTALGTPQRGQTRRRAVKPSGR